MISGQAAPGPNNDDNAPSRPERAARDRSFCMDSMKKPELGVVVITAEQLREVVREAVRDGLDTMPKAPPPMMTPTQVAERLSVCTKTVLNMIGRDELKAKKVGGQWRVRRDELEAWERS